MLPGGDMPREDSVNTRPEIGGIQGSYFGLVVTDGYDWHQCYSWAWENRVYWDVDSRTGNSRSVHEAFPDVDWKEDERGVMEQVLAIAEGYAERPRKVFYEKTVVVRRRAAIWRRRF